MPTKRAILSKLTRDELRIYADYYDLDIYDRRAHRRLGRSAESCARRDAVGTLPGSSEGALPSVRSRRFGPEEGRSRRAAHQPHRRVEEGPRRREDGAVRARGREGRPVGGDAGGRAARAIPLVGRRHPARVDRQQRLQDLHLRPALPQAAVRPLRGGGREARRRRRVPGRRVDRPRRAPVLRARPGAMERHPEAGHQHRRGAEQGVRRPRGAEPRARRRPRRHRLQRRAELGDAKNRDTVLARLVQHFSQVSLRNDRMAEPDLLGRPTST